MRKHLFHRQTRTELPTVVGGSGSWLFAADGRRFLDACGGAAVSCLGHNHPAVTRAMITQAERIAFAHTSFFTNEPAEELAELLADAAPGTLDRVYFVDSGSEAIEAALKMARQYHLERAAPQRRHVIARHRSYHGNTLGALAISGSPARRAPYEPLLFPAALIEPCFAYHHARADETPEAYGARAAAALEAEVERLGGQTVIAFVAETVVGATAGAVPPSPGYFGHIRRICDRHGILLVLDEVMCGAGRTGTFLACEQEGVVPDIVTIAKGLGGGYQPIGAVLCAAHVYEAFALGSATFQHGHTYSAHPIACAAALAVQRVIAEEGLLSRVRTAGDRLRAGLGQRFEQNPNVGDIRGRGLLLAIELVSDSGSKSPFDPALSLNLRVKAEAFARGLMVYPGAGTIDGARGDHILLAPPYTVTDAELDMIVDRLGEAVAAALADVPKGRP